MGDEFSFVAGYAYLPVLAEPIVGGLFPNYPPDAELTFPFSLTLDYRIFTGQIKENHFFAHELGHYLGPRHTFQDCQNGDFCDDTPSHTCPSNPQLQFINNRTNCIGQQIFSTNLMDYVGSVDNFTFDQKERMVKVFENALFMPKDFNAPDARLKPFRRGQLDPSIKPIICNF